MNEKSLLQCTKVKSKHVAMKVLSYSLYAILGALTLYGLYLLLPSILMVLDIVLQSVIYAVTNVQSVVGIVTGLLSLVPWWIYGIICVVLSIPVYSFLWCLNNDMIKEDWGSADKLSDIQFIAMMIGGLSGLVGGGYIGYTWGYNMPQNFMVYGYTTFNENVANVNGFFLMMILGFVLCMAFAGIGVIVGCTIDALIRYHRRKQKELLK